MTCSFFIRRPPYWKSNGGRDAILYYFEAVFKSCRSSQYNASVNLPYNRQIDKLQLLEQHCYPSCMWVVFFGNQLVPPAIQFSTWRTTNKKWIFHWKGRYAAFLALSQNRVLWLTEWSQKPAIKPFFPHVKTRGKGLVCSQVNRLRGSHYPYSDWVFFWPSGPRGRKSPLLFALKVLNYGNRNYGITWREMTSKIPKDTILDSGMWRICFHDVRK